MNAAVGKVAASLAGKTVLISAGGTGGHVYPALAVAKRLREQGAAVEWIGTAAGIESRLVPEASIPLHTIFVQGLRGNGVKRLIKAPFVLWSALAQARKVIRQVDPDIFVGFGGFASGPGALAAKWSTVPVVLHEQNAAMGLTNRWVSKWAKRVLLAFPIEKRQGEVVGNPIRQVISDISAPAERIRSEPPFRVLVVGGSLGAQAINEVVPHALKPLLGEIELTHQTGKTTRMQTIATYQQLGIAEQVNVVEYIDDMATAYATTDLLIARAGALTVSEVASVGIPAIFIPLPHAVDNHQWLNANFLAKQDAAVMIEQKHLNAEHLRQTVERLLADRRLLNLAEKARRQSHAGALSTIVKRITEVIYAQR
ncbi:MAG: undecaprenyldiphospho-muramoylpentapeptide beta-N-acetylglucosaminyltransferase [Gammaproteobacteria bacterium]|nr:MAG: undecaprenyldiphospho-muramoylpentapeptide beta-N-acetylglucosaminyltransferase [Gammaproteobacteria bacterium]